MGNEVDKRDKMSEKKSRSIFRVMLIPLLSVLLVQIFLMIGTFLVSGVFGRLDQNMKDILKKQVENRRDYLLNEMIENWSELDILAEELNSGVKEKLDAGLISMDGLCRDSEEYMLVLNDIVPELINVMYNKQVSGAFVVLKTENMTVQDGENALPGVYLRDLDPKSIPSSRGEDILVQRAPRDVVRTSVLATDVHWKPMFTAEDSIEKPYFYKTYNEVCSVAPEKRTEAGAYGYWTSESYTLSDDNMEAIAYSIPLMLDDGTVYGVLGIELLTDYVRSLLPAGELGQEESSYFLAVSDGSSGELKPIVLTGELFQREEELSHPFLLRDDFVAEEQSGTYYAAAEPLHIYSRNAPFEGEEWYLVGCVPKKSLSAFSSQLKWSFALCVMATLFTGVLGVLLVSYRISKPVKKVVREVTSEHHDKISGLSRTQIEEIDELVDAVARLGEEMLESSTRFLNIINMASVALAGYDIKRSTDSVYVTDNFFALLNMEDMDVNGMTAEEFSRMLDEIDMTLEHTASEGGNAVYTVPLDDGSVRYIRAEERQIGNRQIGLIEDVTASVLERKKIERDRDYDVLTGLLNRQGFKREAEKVFQNPELLKTAAVLMMDLDNLKIINDTFGHQTGDAYIRTASECFSQNVPDKTLVARISGDEFILLFYGYEENVEIWTQVNYLYHKIRTMEFVLPDGENKGVSASGGLAWYPKDSRNLSELMKFSDFAMYCVKKREKGNVGDFDLIAYQEMLRRNQMQQEFYQLLDNWQINYHFQPIFDGRTGKAYAYEALMRVNMPNLRSPVDVLQIARETERMREIETITMFKASETYDMLLGQQQIDPDALLFINSIADVTMTPADDQKYHDRFKHLQPNIVVEITEAENLDMEILRKKKSVQGFSGMLALDDYGSGYNTELNLLEMNPDFIKVDIGIVRNIHLDENKQQIVKNIVEYAHARGMQIIAEGLEYPEEVEQCLNLGVDLLQGYYLAKPGAVPAEISEAAYRQIQEYWKKDRK